MGCLRRVCVPKSCTAATDKPPNRALVAFKKKTAKAHPGDGKTFEFNPLKHHAWEQTYAKKIVKMKEAFDIMKGCFERLVGASSTLAGFQGFIVTMYHQGETAHDGLGRVLNINNTLTAETKEASMLFFVSFAMNMAVMVISLICNQRLIAIADKSDRRLGWALSLMLEPEKHVQGGQNRLWLWCVNLQWGILFHMDEFLRYCFGAGIATFFCATFRLVQDSLLDEQEETVEECLFVIGLLMGGVSAFLWFGFENCASWDVIGKKFCEIVKCCPSNEKKKKEKEEKAEKFTERYESAAKFLKAVKGLKEETQVLYASCFAAHGLTDDMLLELEGDVIRSQILAEVGITNVADRCTILIHIAKQQNSLGFPEGHVDF